MRPLGAQFSQRESTDTLNDCKNLWSHFAFAGDSLYGSNNCSNGRLAWRFASHVSPENAALIQQFLNNRSGVVGCTTSFASRHIPERDLDICGNRQTPRTQPRLRTRSHNVVTRLRLQSRPWCPARLPARWRLPRNKLPWASHS